MDRLKRILCFEDHRDTSFLVSCLLRQSSYDVVICRKKQEAFDWISGYAFDLYLLDIRLSDGMAVELCRFIRSEDLDTPVMFYTAHPTKQQRVQAMRAGAHLFWQQCEDPVELKEMLDQLFAPAARRAKDSPALQLAKNIRSARGQA